MHERMRPQSSTQEWLLGHLPGLARTTCLGMLLLGLHRPLQGQGVAPGERVRITRPGSPTPILVGQFVRATTDTIWLTPEGQAQPTGVPLGASIGLERSLGRHSHTLTGALIGAGVGAGITLLFLSGFCGGDTLCDGDEQLRAAAIFGLPSIALGAGIGATIRTERWKPVSSGAPTRTPTIQFGLRVDWPD